MKIKRNNRIFGILMATLIVFAGVLFFGINPTYAKGTCKYQDAEGVVTSKTVDNKDICDAPPLRGTFTEEVVPPPEGGTCTYPNPDAYDTSKATLVKTVTSAADCTGPGETFNAGATYTETVRAAETTRQAAARDNLICKDVDFNWGQGVLVCALLHVLDMNGSILKMSLVLFSSVADADKATAVMKNPAVYATWGTVRDLANLSFILILIFSAFATIFQVDKYNYKKLLLWVIIMALLVNFSFPITLFIIDIANSLMYTLFQQALGSKDPSVSLMGFSPLSGPLQGILSPGPNASLSGLLLAIIFIFILALTILALALILLIRTIALTILIILSPLGFVGVIVGKGGEWWNNLFKYAMAGPIIGLVLLIAMKLMDATTELAKTGNDEPLIASMAQFIVPIVILWIGMTMAVKNIDGAGGVMNKVRGGGVNLAKKFGKGAWKSTGAPGTIKQTADHYKKKGVLGIGGSEKTEDREKKWTAALTGDKGFAARKEQHDMAQKAKQYKDENETVDNLKTKCQAGDAAACHRLSEDDNMDTATYSAMAGHASISTGLKATINRKVKNKRADLVANHEANTADIAKERTRLGATATGFTDNQVRQHLVEEKMGNLTAEKLAEQDWSKINAMPAGIEKTRAIHGMVGAIHGLDPDAQIELRKRLSKTSRTSINSLAGANIV